MRAKTNANTPASAPANKPRAMIRFSIVRCRPLRSVAGEAEQMAGVVDEFVHVGVAAEQGRGALVDSDEVEDDQSEEHRARQPERGACAGQVDGADPGGRRLSRRLRSLG